MTFVTLTGPKYTIDQTVGRYLTKYAVHLENAMVELIENPVLAENLAKNAIEVNDSLELSKIMNQWIQFIKKTTAEKH